MTLSASIRHVLLGATVLGLMAAGAAARADTRIAGSGTATSETRQVGAFQGIHLKSAIELRVRQSTRDTVELRADDNILPVIETKVVDHRGVPTLELAVREGVSVSTRTKIVATVEVATLKALAVSGSGDVVADGIKTSDLRAVISGAGDMRLNQLDTGALSVVVSGSGDVAAQGRAGSLAITISGSGDVAARELPADEVKVSVAGSGSAKVHARKSLAVSIAGSGNVGYAGEATPAVSVMGSGSVKKL